MIHQFKLVKNLRPNVNRPVWHSAISFAPQDVIDDLKMKQIADEYLQEIGLQNNQYLMVKHNDTNHKHVHIIINRVGFDGSLMRDWKSGYRTKKIMQELEKRHNLKIAVDQGNKRKEDIAVTIANGITKKKNVSQIMGDIENLGYKIQYNKTKAGNIRGVSFINKELGISFKSSSIDRNYSYSNLIKLTAEKSNMFQSKKISR